MTENRFYGKKDAWDPWVWGKGMEAEIWMKVFELEIGVNAK